MIQIVPKEISSILLKWVCQGQEQWGFGCQNVSEEFRYSSITNGEFHPSVQCSWFLCRRQKNTSHINQKNKGRKT